MSRHTGTGLLVAAICLGSGWGTVSAEPICASNSGVEQVECLRMRLCPEPASVEELAECYREIAVALASPTELAAEQAPPANATSAGASTGPDSLPQSPEDAFGLPAEEKKLSRSNRVKGIEANIVFVEKSIRGRYLIGLDNGQLWSENEPSSSFLKPGHQVRISRGLMGSYKLTPKNGRTTVVHRLLCQGPDRDKRCALLDGDDR